ncbi:hypothetical protein ACFPRL_19770 [Pseudoclavibacter helvolus]
MSNQTAIAMYCCDAANSLPIWVVRSSLNVGVVTQPRYSPRVSRGGQVSSRCGSSRTPAPRRSPVRTGGTQARRCHR